MEQLNQTTEMTTKPIPLLLTIRQFTEKYPAFSENSLRWLIFHRKTNGFGHCFCKMGKKRIFVDEAAFFAKIEQNRMA